MLTRAADDVTVDKSISFLLAERDAHLKQMHNSFLIVITIITQKKIHLIHVIFTLGLNEAG